MPRKPFKPSLTTLCALSAVGLDVRLTPGGKEVGRRAFTAADLKRVAFSAADRRAAPQSLEWLRRHKIIQGPVTHALTDRGIKVAQRACKVLARRGR